MLGADGACSVPFRASSQFDVGPSLVQAPLADGREGRLRAVHSLASAPPGIWRGRRPVQNTGAGVAVVVFISLPLGHTEERRYLWEADA